MKHPRLVRLAASVWHDHTRPTEWWDGAGAAVVGLFMLTLFLPCNPATALGLWRWAGPTAEGWALVGLGTAQFLAAGTKWVALRRWVATAMAMVWLYVATVYWLTQPRALPAILLVGPLARACWVAARIAFDKEVNGADRRMRRQFYGDEGGAVPGSRGAHGLAS